MPLEAQQVLDIDGVDEILETLNESGQKQVFIARTGQQRCAIKVLHIAQSGVVFESRLQRIDREISLINSLESPYTPKLGPLKPMLIRTGNDVHIVYSEEYIPGKDVSELIDSGYFSDPEKVKKLIHDVAEAIKVYWSEANETVHRDVKPQNIRLNEETDSFVLIDAGIAYVRNRTNFTPTGFRAPGTPGFMAPEHFVTGMEFSYKTDLYCLGVVAYLAASGNHPTHDDTLDDEANERRIVNITPVNLDRLNEDIPEAIVNLVMKMLEKQPHMRPRRISDIIDIAQED